ncbi:MAG: hypothetical protein ACREOG_14825 [Gemmatimonadaceae bacterium]
MAAQVPRTVDARAIVTPFDSLVWKRSRIQRFFGMKYTIELYDHCRNASMATTCARFYWAICSSRAVISKRTASGRS